MPFRAQTQKVNIDGRTFEQITYQNERGFFKRTVVGIAGGAIQALGIQSEWGQKAWEYYRHGERKILTGGFTGRGVDALRKERLAPTLDPTSKAKNRLIERLGYDPKDPESIRAYLARPEIRAQLIKVNGHYVLPELRRNGTSSFLFVPDGDFSKATSIRVADAKTGEKLKGKEFHRAMNTYCSQYEDMCKGIDTLISGYISRKHPDFAKFSPAKKKKIKDNLRKMMQPVLDYKGEHGRLYLRDPGPNKRGDYNSFLKGIRYDWSASTKKDVKAIHNAAPDKKLSEDKPFEHKSDEDVIAPKTKKDELSNQTYADLPTDRIDTDADTYGSDDEFNAMINNLKE